VSNDHDEVQKSYGPCSHKGTPRRNKAKEVYAVRTGRLQVGQISPVALARKPAEELGSECRAYASGDGNRSRLEDYSFVHPRAPAAVMEETYAETKAPRPNNAAITRVMEPNAAGIDIGATEIFVAVPADRDPQPVRSFATFTCELEKIALGLKSAVLRALPWSPLVYSGSLIPDPGGQRISSLVGECPTRKERSGPEDRCRGTASGCSTCMQSGCFKPRIDRHR
jgi:hypothetical protein